MNPPSGLEATFLREGFKTISSFFKLKTSITFLNISLQPLSLPTNLARAGMIKGYDKSSLTLSQRSSSRSNLARILAILPSPHPMSRHMSGNNVSNHHHHHGYGYDRAWSQQQAQQPFPSYCPRPCSFHNSPVLVRVVDCAIRELM